MARWCGLAIGTTCALAPSVAYADPIITPLVSAALTAITGSTAFGSTVLIGTLTVSGLIGSIVTTVLGIGLSLLFAPKPKTPPMEAGRIPVQQALPYCIFGYGEVPHAGILALKEEAGGYLVQVQAISARKVDSFTGLYLNEDLVEVPASGGNLNGYVPVGDGNRYSGNSVRIETRLGEDTETSYSFITALAPTIWDSSHRGDYTASLAMSCAPIQAKWFSANYPYGPPQPRPIVRWAKCYDWRDVAQDIDDPDTWVWTKNPVLQIVDHFCHNPFGFRETFAARILPVIDEWTDEADICDEAEPLKAGGTEPKYEAHFATTTEPGPISTLVTLLQACDGHLVRAAKGLFRLKVGKYRDSGVVITDDDIARVKFQTGQTTENAVNEATATYTYPGTGYTTVESDPRVDTADQAIRPGPPRKSKLDIQAVQSPGQASRLLYREMHRQSRPVRGTIVLFWSGLNAAYERWFTINSNSIPRLNGAVVENLKPTISARQMRVEIDFVIIDPDLLEGYSAASDETTHPTIPDRPSTAIAAPDDVHASGVLISDEAGGGAIVLSLDWDDPGREGLTYFAHWRLADDGSGSPGPWSDEMTFSEVTVSAGRVYVQTGTVPSGALEVEVSAGAGMRSAWSTTVAVSTVLADLAPAAPVWVGTTSHAGSVDLEVTAPMSANFYAIQFHEVATGGGFGSSTPIGAPVTGSPGSSVVYTRTVSPGTRDYFAVAITSASVASTPAGPQSGTST